MPRFRSVAAVAVCFALATSANAEIVNVTASINSTVRQITNGIESQSDSATMVFPTTGATLPLTALSKLTTLDTINQPIAAGRAATVFNGTAPGLFGSANDLGIDLAGYSLEPLHGWIVESNATETRTIKFNPGELLIPSGRQVKVGGSLYLSGALVLTASDATRDLSGASAEISFSISSTSSVGAGVLLEGGGSIVGGPNGETTRTVSGVVDGNTHDVVVLDGLIPMVPLVRVLVFNAIVPIDQYAYDYVAKVDEQFDLTLTFKAKLTTLPNGVGGGIVFGLPQDGVVDIFQTVQQTQQGQRIKEEVAKLVDTTGLSAPQPSSTITPISSLPGFLSLCGVLGIESYACGAAFAAWFAIRPIRRGRSR